MREAIYVVFKEIVNRKYNIVWFLAVHHVAHESWND